MMSKVHKTKSDEIQFRLRMFDKRNDKLKMELKNSVVHTVNKSGTLNSQQTQAFTIKEPQKLIQSQQDEIQQLKQDLINQKIVNEELLKACKYYKKMVTIEKSQHIGVK